MTKGVVKMPPGGRYTPCCFHCGHWDATHPQWAFHHCTHPEHVWFAGPGYICNDFSHDFEGSDYIKLDIPRPGRRAGRGNKPTKHTRILKCPSCGYQWNSRRHYDAMCRVCKKHFRIKEE